MQYNRLGNTGLKVWHDSVVLWMRTGALNECCKACLAHRRLNTIHALLKALNTSSTPKSIASPNTF